MNSVFNEAGKLLRLCSVNGGWIKYELQYWWNDND